MPNEREGRFRPQLLHRPRIDALLKDILEVPLYFVIASMGYGKSTAVHSFLCNLPNRNIRQAWLTLSSWYDANWAWQELAHSIEPLDAHLSSQLATCGPPRTKANMQQILGFIGESVVRPTVIVIDDYQEGESALSNEMLVTLAKRAIPHLHIVVISRLLPDIPLEELTLKGKCAILSQQDLEFREEETAQLFAQNKFVLSRQEHKTLVGHTDGWVAAIYLSLVRYAQDQTVEGVEDIRRLLKKTVYDHFDAKTQECLLMLSVVDNFSLAGAQHIAGCPNSGELLMRLAANNCFVRYDERTKTYSMHTLLKEMLSELLTVSHIDQQALFERCGDWFANQGKSIEAIDFYTRSGSHDKILDMFARPAATELLDQAPEIVIRAFSAMDLERKLARPLAYITYIISYLLGVDAVKGARLLCEAKAHYSRQKNLPNRQRILGEIALAESFLQFPRPRAMHAYQKKAYALLAGGTSTIANPHAVFSFGSPHILYLYHREQGKLASLVKRFSEDFWHFSHLANNCGSGCEDVARAEYSLETGDLAGVEHAAEQALFKANTKQQLGVTICATLCLARHATLCGDPLRAIALLDALNTEVRGKQHSVLSNILDLASGYVYGTLGQINGIPHWLREGDLSSCGLFHQGMGISYVVTGIAAILQNRYVELEVIVETMRTTYKPNCHIFGLLHASIYDAIAKKHLYGLTEAKQALMPGLRLAHADGILTPFAEHIPELEPILQEIDTEQHGFAIHSILELGERFLAAHRKITRLAAVPLTARELEVLNRLKDGVTQREMAKMLCVSQNTVRRHLQNIYNKLGVGNKTVAINRARELGII